MSGVAPDLRVAAVPLSRRSLAVLGLASFAGLMMLIWPLLLQVPEGTTGVVIRNVAPAIASLLQEDDVITQVGLPIRRNRRGDCFPRGHSPVGRAAEGKGR